MFKMYNPNPENLRTDDCTVRAISKILGISWDAAYLSLTLIGFQMKAMPDAIFVWGSISVFKWFY